MLKDIQTDAESKLCDETSRIFREMKQEKELIHTVITDVIDLFRPQKLNLDYLSDGDLSASAKIYDGAAIAAKDQMVSGMFAWTMPPYSDWLELQVSRIQKSIVEESKSQQRLARMYGNRCSDFLADVFSRSNFYSAMAQDYDDIITLGTTCMFTDEDDDEGITCYTPIHFRELHCVENQYGRVDTVYRVIEMTANQFVSRFEDDLNEEDKKKYAKWGLRKMYVLNTLYPRTKYTPGGFNQEKRYASNYFLMTGPSGISLKLIKESGFDTQNFSVCRNIKITNFSYGSSQAIEAIYDTKMLNAMHKSMADAGQLAGNPAYLVDMNLKEGLAIRPGGRTYRDGMEEIKQISSAGAYPYGIDVLNRTTDIIRKHFKTDFFQPASSVQDDSRKRTRAEIYELKAESAGALSTMLTQIEQERIRPVVMQTIANEKKHGRWPEPPQGMSKDFRFDMKLIGSLYQAQRRYIADQRVSGALVSALQFANADPNVMMLYDTMEASRDVARMKGLPEKYIRDDDSVSKDIHAKQQRDAQMFQMQIQSMQARDLPAKAKGAEPNSVLERELAQADQGGA